MNLMKVINTIQKLDSLIKYLRISVTLLLFQSLLLWFGENVIDKESFVSPQIFFVISSLPSLIQILKPDVGECVFNVNAFLVFHEVICYFNQSKRERGKHEDEIKPYLAPQAG